MILDLFANPILFIIGAFSLLIAVDIHEFAHAWMADRLGDPTPRAHGRLTLNPIAHLDPIGTLMILLTWFGWGKPVPVDSYNLENPRRDAALISLAGPASNLILATILSLIIKLHLMPLSFSLLITSLIILNVRLAIFNLLPVPPLDGSKILLGILPSNMALEWQETLSQYGLFLIIFLIFPFFGRSLASIIIMPIINIIFGLLL